MFLTVKRRSLMILLAFIVGVTVFCLGVSVATNPTLNIPKNGKTVVIDAGHGGRDAGVTGVSTGVKESDINLAVAKKLRHFLLSFGYDVVMTRSSSEGLYSVTSRNKKLDDMQKRRAIIEEASPDLVISIHQNFFPISSVRGGQAFYAPTSEVGKAMADTMQNIFNSNLEATSKSSAKGDYYILQCSEYPSVLVECGFLSNIEDEKLLTSGTYQEKVAYTIFTAINSILLSA